MATINESLLEQIAAAVARSGFDKAGRSAVQQQFAEIKLTYCLLDEMGPKEPFCEYEGFALFLEERDKGHPSWFAVYKNSVYTLHRIVLLE